MIVFTHKPKTEENIIKKEFTEIVGRTEIRYVLDEATETYLPNWELPEQCELARYGRMRAEFLKENHKGLYQAMLIKGTLNDHCAVFEDTAYERLDRIVKAMSKADGITEAMKNTDPLHWVTRCRTPAPTVILAQQRLQKCIFQCRTPVPMHLPRVIPSLFLLSDSKKPMRNT